MTHDSNPQTKLSHETTSTVRTFVRTAIHRLNTELANHPPEWTIESRWVRGADGQFRQSTKHRRRVNPLYDDMWLHSTPGYEHCLAQLRLDPLVASHFDRLVGIQLMSSSLEADLVLRVLVSESITDQGPITCREDRFDEELRSLQHFRSAATMALKAVAPIPGLHIDHRSVTVIVLGIASGIRSRLDTSSASRGEGQRTRGWFGQS